MKRENNIAKRKRNQGKQELYFENKQTNDMLEYYYILDIKT